MLNSQFSSEGARIAICGAMREKVALSDQLEERLVEFAAKSLVWLASFATTRFMATCSNLYAMIYSIARNYFSIKGSTLKRNQFGGTIGGPILQTLSFYSQDTWQVKPRLTVSA